MSNNNQSQNRILYIDQNKIEDEPFLRDFGLDVNFINVDNFDGLNKALDDPPHIALINLTRRSKKNVEFIREIRKRSKDLPIFAISDKKDPRIVMEAARYSIQGFFRKPFEKKEFIDKISSFLPLPLEKNTEEKTGNFENSGERLWSDEASLVEIFHLGQTKMTQDNYESSIVCFEHIATQKRFKNNQEVIIREKSLFEIARCYLKLKKYPTAVKKFQEFLKLCPKSILVNDAWFFLGEIYDGANKTESAITCFKKAALIPNNERYSTILKAKKRLKKMGITLL